TIGRSRGYKLCISLAVYLSVLMLLYTSVNRALFAYDGVTNRLRLSDSGVGGVLELASKLHPRRPLYGLCRVEQPGPALSHIVMIIWVGEGVDDYRRAECATHVPAIRAFFKVKPNTHQMKVLKCSEY
uniref:ADF-H domain-containing protein n=1 Tax=Electrophorus electricus TaxID=8005 RepID=A0A4W4FVQ1_ELEEL